MGNLHNVFVRTIVLSLTWILNAQTPWGGKVMAGFTSFTTSGGAHYLLSDFTAAYSSVTAQCNNQGADPPTFADNAEYQDFADYLTAAGGYDSRQIWVTITKSGSKFYFSGGEEINNSNWFTDEPNYTCRGTCCYRAAKIISSTVESKHLIADNSCTKSYYILCRGSVTTTTAPTTTPTTTPTTPTTTPTTTTPTPTTTPTTTPTITPTTTPTTATTTPPTTPTTTPTTVTTTNPTTATAMTPTAMTPTALPSSDVGAEEAVDLSTGEQMTVLYLGFIIGGSILISCICSCCWLAINRGIRRRHKHYKLEKKEEEGDKDIDESDEE